MSWLFARFSTNIAIGIQLVGSTVKITIGMPFVYTRILKVARTIADLDGSTNIS